MNPVALATFKVLCSHKWPVARRLDRAEREGSLTIIENSIGQHSSKKSNVQAINTSNNICKVIAKRISGIGDHWNKPETPRERLPVWGKNKTRLKQQFMICINHKDCGHKDQGLGEGQSSDQSEMWQEMPRRECLEVELSNYGLKKCSVIQPLQKVWT